MFKETHTLVNEEALVQKKLDDKEKLIVQLLDLFDTNFVSMDLIERLFGEVGVEEETLFF